MTHIGEALCPCGLGLSYQVCCQPLHTHQALPATAEALMRSRFCAFYLKNSDYIIATTVPAQQLQINQAQLQAWANQTNWTRLQVQSHQLIGKRHAQVAFCAYFKDEAGEQAHKERSAFVKIDERWFFLDHSLPCRLANKQPCLCGSGIKFKQCCGRFLF